MSAYVCKLMVEISLLMPASFLQVVEIQQQVIITTCSTLTSHYLHTCSSLLAGSDYTPFDDLRLTFTPGDSRLCEPFLIRADGAVEGAETVTISLRSTDTNIVQIGGIGNVTITILDDDREFLDYDQLLFTSIKIIS